MRTRAFTMAIALLGSAGCDSLSGSSGSSGASCESDGDCKNGFLCEERTCVPEKVAKAARESQSGSADTAAPATAATGAATADEVAAATAPACGDASKVPDIPSDRSDPPKLTEWDDGCEVNTQGAGSQPSDCTMRVLREWLQVTCRGDYSGFEKMQDFGKEGFDYFQQIQPGNVVSFVMALKKGRNQQIRICGQDRRASLFVSWPGGQDKPLHIALAKGPACDGSAWGAR